MHIIMENLRSTLHYWGISVAFAKYIEQYSTSTRELSCNKIHRFLWHKFQARRKSMLQIWQQMVITVHDWSSLSAMHGSKIWRRVVGCRMEQIQNGNRDQNAGCKTVEFCGERSYQQESHARSQVTSDHNGVRERYTKQTTQTFRRI